MSRPIIFGDIKGIKEGKRFKGRKEMMTNSFHRRWGSGIDGNGNEGTAAIVLSGGYEDDEDQGDQIIYTGAGGNDSNSKKQIEDQSWKNSGNAGLLVSMNKGLPVRVIRGFQHKSDFSPKNGYAYAGLYSVVDAWIEKGKSNHKICRFRLVYSGNNSQRKSPEEIELDYNTKDKKRIAGTVLRIVRDSKITRQIKTVYNYECQVCRTYIDTKHGRYAEGAHIKPLGKPHDGDDNSNNLLCLCPNHHVMFDKGMFSIKNNLELIGGVTGLLNLHKKHKLSNANLKYHRKSHGYS